MSQNQIGVHAGLWGFDWSDEAAQKKIATASEIGFDHIEIPAIDRKAYDPMFTKKLLEKHQIAATVSLALDFESDINSVDSTTSALGEHRLLEAVEFASEIGATFVGGVIYSAMGRYLHLPTDKARDNSLAVLRRVAAKAKKLSITLGVEYVNRYESNLLNNVRQTLAFLEVLDVDNAVVHLDTFHANLEEAKVSDPIVIAGDQLGYIHMSESHRGKLGTGSINWDNFFEVLVQNNNKSLITLETFSAAVINQQQQVDIGLWNVMWRNPDQVAAESLAFIQSKLATAVSKSK